jgi:dipeptidyl aminopeptidase/acylaminoacyl peptidase
MQARESGTHAYLERRAIDDDAAAPVRVWESQAGVYETVIDVMTADGTVLLTQHETSLRPPNYFVRNLRSRAETRVTDFVHPAPELARARRIPLRYARGDGQELSSTLYVPADHQSGDPLPLIVWAYPRQYGSEAPLAFEAAQRFPGFNDAFKLFFLLRGYAVMDNVAMPVIGNSADANDTFIDQIVANAKAAIEAAASTGVADAKRVGVAGHSYGAFMVANLLAHSSLFQAGVAMSGAYNRTLTPFGFQTERRTLWEARDTYLELSPILYSNRIEAPLLLVHGLLDENAGTQPIQSTYFYEAIRRNGGEAELLLLPLEGHSYRGRESVLQTAAAMLDWFERHLKTADASAVGAPTMGQSAPAAP